MLKRTFSSLLLAAIFTSMASASNCNVTDNNAIKEGMSRNSVVALENSNVSNEYTGLDINKEPFKLKDGITINIDNIKDGYMLGKSKDTFDSTQTLTRAEFVTILSRILKFSEEKPIKSFEDIKGHWAKEYIEKIASQGIINGVSATEFNPDAFITREQVYIMLSRFIDVSSYSDVNPIMYVDEGYIYNDVPKLLNSGIYRQYPEDKSIDVEIERGEMIHIINSLIYRNHEVNTNTESLLETNGIFKDLTSNKYYPYYEDCINSININNV